MNEIKTGVLLTSPLDLDFLKKNKTIFAKARRIAHDYFIIQLMPHIEIDYFFKESFGDSTAHNMIRQIGQNWSRNNKGVELFEKGGISIAPIVNRRITAVFSNVYRNYLALKVWFEFVDVLYVSINESAAFKLAAKVFDDRIQYYDPGHRKIFTQASSSPDRVRFGHHPVIHPLSRIARLIQKPFLNFAKKKKHLNFPDWTSAKLLRKDKDTLLGNSPFPWKGYYYLEKDNNIKEAEGIFPERITQEHVNAFLTVVKSLIKDDRLLSIFVKILKEEYSLGRPVFIRTYAIYKELFDYYTPEIISVPGETHFAYIIAVQIAKKMRIKTILILDGYQTIFDPFMIYPDSDNESYLFSHFSGFGDAGVEQLLKVGVNQANIIKMSPPVLSNYEVPEKREILYDCIILFPYPHIHNPATQWDRRFEYIIDIVKVVLELGYTHIAIKMKTGPNYKQDEDRDLMEKIIKLNDFPFKIKILSGLFQEHIFKTSCCIGQASTPVIESFFCDIPYYVFEPYKNGVTDEMIVESSIFSEDSISRTPEQLYHLMSMRKQSVIVDQKYAFSGGSLNEINLIKKCV